MNEDSTYATSPIIPWDVANVTRPKTKDIG